MRDELERGIYSSDDEGSVTRMIESIGKGMRLRERGGEGLE